MKKILFLLSCVIILTFYFISCKKPETANGINDLSAAKNSYLNRSITSCINQPIIDSMPAFDIDADSVETPTILGNQRTNPYTIPNMQQAYADLGLTSILVNVTNLYVRFLPNSAQQLSVLDSITDTQGLDLFDTPMDYDVLQEGDYYQDPSIPDSSVTWQYAVVPANYQPPAGITYQILSQIHIPGDDYTAVETEAERLASIQDSINCSNGGSMQSSNLSLTHSLVIPPQCQPGSHWDDVLKTCVPDETSCPPGYDWDPVSKTCVPSQTTPPPPAPDAQVPAGIITVSDVNLNTTPGVRNVRVVAKRWFKIERTYTDNNGNFHFTKHFKHKVKINVKFKNDNAVIKAFRLSSYWRMLYPITKTIGVYKSNKNNIQYNFQKYNTSIADKGNLYWAGATAHNSVMEYRDYAVQEGIGLPPDHLKIFLTRWSYGSGMTPMWNKRWYSDLPQEIVINFFLYYTIPPAGDVSAIYTILKLEMDIGISYRAPSSDYTSMYSDDLKETVYHELTHAAQYSALGNSWYSNFVNAEANEIANTAFSDNSPYGDGSNTVNSPIIALGESWAYHIGQYFADKKYGGQSSCAGEQFTCYGNNFIPGLNSHLIALENYNPTLFGYQFDWIPKGVYYDMIDNGEPPTTFVNDQVLGYTNQQFFNAFNSNITSLGAYRQNLLQQNGNNQQVQVQNLFASYGY